MSFVKKIQLKTLGDERGQLVVLEGKQEVPFDIKRVYYIYELDADLPRGFHAHKKTQQIAKLF